MTSMYRSRRTSTAAVPRIPTAVPRTPTAVPRIPTAAPRISVAVETTSAAVSDTALGSLVTAAAQSAPDAPALFTPARAITFEELHARAQGAALALSSDQVVDDSALTMALMMCVPGLAVSGPDGLAATLSSVRVQATMAVAGA